MADILGTNGNDAIDGTAGDDLITGGVGNDTIEAGAGNDTLIGDGGSAGGTGSSGTILGDGPGSTGGGYDRVYAQSVYNGNHSFSTDAFYLGNDIPVLDDANRDAITGVSFSQDGEGTDRTFGLDELTFTGAQRSFVGLVTVQDSDVYGANDQFSSSISGGFQDTTVVSSGTADFTMNDGQVFQGIRVNFVRGPDGETYMMPDDGPSPDAFNSFRNMLANNDSGIDSFKIATGSGDDAGINPIEGNWADGQFAEITNPPVGDSFDDVLCGDEGDDIIYGDGGDSATAAGFGVAGGLLGDGPGSTGGGYDRVYAQSEYNGNHSFSTDAFYLGNDIPVLDDANRNAITGVSFSQDGEGTDRTFGLDELSFTGAQRSYVGLVTVQNVDVHNANDQFSSSLSGGFQDVQVVSSGTADFTMNDGQVFQGIRVNFVRGPDGETFMMPDDGPSPYAFNAFRAMLINNSSGIDSFTIATGSGDDAGINPIEGNWADGQFKVTQDGEGGDDIIKGGAGSDTMFGEGGDDTFLVESAADGAGDVVVGGNGPDQNTDTDVLDLRGAGVVTIDAVADDNDAGAQSGTVTFNNGETLTFEGIEEILQDVPTLTVEPGPNTPIDPATGLPVTQENGDPVELVVTRNTPTDEALEVTIQNGDPSETNPPLTVTIPAGEDSVAFLVDPVDDPIVDGDQTSPITATASDFTPDTQDVTVADDDVLTLTVEPGPNQPVDPATGLPVTQEQGDPVEIVITRNGPTQDPLVVTLTDGDPSETDSPTTVTIPAGQDSVTVLVDPVDDPLVDGDQTAPITVSAPGYPDTVQEVIVEDDDVPTLTIEPDPNAPIDPATGNPLTAENGTPAQIVITRNTDTTDPLEVFLFNGDPTETDAPTSVIIPAGQDSVTVDIPSVDDPIVDGDQVSTITATAPGFVPAAQDVTVADDDVLTLTVEPGPNQPVDPATGLPVTQEQGDPVEIVITRNGPTQDPLVVTLTDGDPSETDSPTTVTIPAGQDSVTVLVDPVDDPLVDGDQTAPITVSAPGYPDTVQEVIVEDDDVPTLTIEPDPNAPIDPATGNPLTAENGTPAQIVITRNTDTTDPLEVFLFNGDPTETDAPTSVIIPAGQDSVTVDIPSVDDPIVDGDQVSTITATAPGFVPAAQDVTVADDDVLTLTVEPGPNQPVDPATGLPVTQEQGDPVEIVITRNGPTQDPLVVTLTDGDPSETDSPTTVTIPAGQDSVTVLVDPVDDPLVDGDQTAPITVSAPGYPDTVQEVIVEDDDVPTLTIEPDPNAPIDPATGNPLTAENGTPAQIVITRNTDTTDPLEVFLFNGDPTETDAPTSVIIPAGQDSVTVDIPSVDDPIVDGDQVSTITATAPGFVPAAQDVTVADDDVLTLTVEPGPNQPVDPATGLPVTQEQGDPVEIVITRNGPTQDPLVVTLTDGDPSETDSPTTVTIPAGQDSVTVLVDPVDDPLVDGDQTAPITVSAPGYPDTVQEVIVEDDDVPTLTIEPDPNAPIDPATGNPLTAENGTPAQIVITRNTDTTDPLEVFLFNGDPTETDAPTSVIIPAGQDSVTVDIPSVDDPIVDGDQVSTITATAPGFVPAAQDVTVADDDVLTLTVEPGPNQPVDPATGLPVTQEQGDPVEIVITRNGPTQDPLVVTLTDGDPSETDSPTTVTIPAGQDSVTVLVDPVDDPLVDGDQTAPITVSAPGYPDTVQEVIVEDDDVPTLTIEPDPNAPIDPATGNPLTAENGTPAQIVITRNTDTTDPLEVFLFNGDPTETDAPTSVIIPAGQDSVTVDIPSVDDPIVDGDQVSTITATAPGFVPAAQDVTVADDDVLTLTVEPGPNQPVDPATGLPVTQEQGDPVEIVITRNGPTQDPLVVTLTDGDPSETDSPTTVTIPAGQDSVTVLVDPVDDPLVDGDQTAPITVSAPGYPDTVQEVIVEDDDVPTLTIEPDPNAPIDPATGNPVAVEGGAPASIIVTRNTPTTTDLVVTLTHGDTTETEEPITVIIPAGQSSVQVTVPAVDDTIVDGDQFSVITASAPGFEPDLQPVKVIDNDVNQFAPVAGDDVVAEIQEDTPATIDVLVNDVDPDGDDANLIISDAGVLTGGGTVEIVNNKLFYTPAPNYNGLVELTYEITDEQGLTDTATVTICCVKAVNDPPVANDDFRSITYDFYESDANGVIGIRNVLRNDDDPDLIYGDEIKVVAAGGDVTPNTNGWFDWTDASEGGQIRVNADGRSQFRNGDVFADLPEGESITTFIEYTIEDLDGSPATAKVGVTINGTAPVDPGTASVGDTVWVDTNGNGVLDGAEQGRDGVEVTLLADLDDDGDVDDVVTTTTTMNGGQYLFDNLDAGDYAIMFTEPDGFDFTTPGDDADDLVNNDSDAGPGGMTEVFSLSVGEAERDIDAGLVEENLPPEPMDDMLKICADEEGVAFVLNNDMDPEFDMLSIVEVDGQAIVPGGSITTSAGTIVSLDSFFGTSSLRVDGEVAYAALDIGAEAMETITYTVSDGNGNFATANLDVTFCGDANSLEALCDTLPDTPVNYQVRATNGVAPFEPEAFSIKISGTGDARFDDAIFEQAYCLSIRDPSADTEDFATAPIVTADMYCSTDLPAGVFNANQVSVANNLNAAENMDLVNYILNQDYESQGFTGWEVQLAIWELTDSFDTDVLVDFNPDYGDKANIDLIVDDALSLAGAFDAGVDSFTVGVGDVVGIVLDPNPVTTDNAQPFIIAVDWEDIDCLCIDNSGTVLGTV